MLLLPRPRRRPRPSCRRPIPCPHRELPAARRPRRCPALSRRTARPVRQRGLQPATLQLRHSNHRRRPSCRRPIRRRRLTRCRCPERLADRRLRPGQGERPGPPRLMANPLQLPRRPRATFRRRSRTRGPPRLRPRPEFRRPRPRRCPGPAHRLRPRLTRAVGRPAPSPAFCRPRAQPPANLWRSRPRPNPQRLRRRQWRRGCPPEFGITGHRRLHRRPQGPPHRHRLLRPWRDRRRRLRPGLHRLRRRELRLRPWPWLAPHHRRRLRGRRHLRLRWRGLRRRHLLSRGLRRLPWRPRRRVRRRLRQRGRRARRQRPARPASRGVRAFSS